MDDNAISELGSRYGWGAEHDFGLRQADRRRHLYVVGKTGTGKTALLRNLVIQDIEAGRGVAVLDPHGDLAEELLDHMGPGVLKRGGDCVDPTLLLTPFLTKSVSCGSLCLGLWNPAAAAFLSSTALLDSRLALRC